MFYQYFIGGKMIGREVSRRTKNHYRYSYLNDYFFSLIRPRVSGDKNTVCKIVRKCERVKLRRGPGDLKNVELIEV